MEEGKFIEIIQTVLRFTVITLLFTIILGAMGIYFYTHPELLYRQPKDAALIETTFQNAIFKDSLHIATGLIQGEHLELVIANCTGCHSSKLITQNRATKEGWVGMIRWMQKTQNLPDLGINEEKIVTYLAKHYAPQKQGRRKPLADIEWYILE